MGTEPSTSERELIARARGGDRDAFCALARRYERRVHSLALHYCRHTADAEDLSQEVWLRAYRALAGFRAEASFYTWLRQITVNTFLNHRRADAFTQHGAPSGACMLGLDEAAAEHEPAQAYRVEAALHDRLLVAQVMRALA